MERLISILQVLSAHRTAWIASLLIVCLMTGFVAPTPVKAQFGIDTAIIVAAIEAIGNALSEIIGSALRTLSGIMSAVQSVLAAIMNFFENVVYPRALIARAQALADLIRGIFAAIRGIMNTPVNSATLPNPQALETILLSKDAGNIGAVTGAFNRVYQAIPTPSQAAPEVRDLIDMTDAQAQAAMKRSLAIDQIAEQTMDAADRVSAELVIAAPGTAPMVEASAVALLVRAHANTQAAMAELMRVRAIALANDGAQLKMNAQHANAARQAFSDVLRR